MSRHATFDEALSRWRLAGGAMMWCGAAWTVLPADEADKQDEMTARQLTEHALSAGGFTRDEVAHELANWEPTAREPEYHSALMASFMLKHSAGKQIRFISVEYTDGTQREFRQTEHGSRHYSDAIA